MILLICSGKICVKVFVVCRRAALSVYGPYIRIQYGENQLSYVRKVAKLIILHTVHELLWSFLFPHSVNSGVKRHFFSLLAIVELKMNPHQLMKRLHAYERGI